MNASKTLIAALAAASIVGTVGYVSAQTSDSAAPAAQQTTPSTAPADMSPPPYVAQDNAVPASPAATDTSTPSASELAPKADRN